MGEIHELKVAYDLSLLKKQIRNYQLENELLVRENQLLKQQVRVLKAKRSMGRGRDC
ncbi:hypothetical protein JCM9140_3771 [Halalkalibacter wakoensis JCM 9140]|uniref:Uncharacterized protein n=1 Tax=Halalkalibacter wakoensis JCM 9140 TaxID=1236970 RepID=W4Q7E5_9BACI|nr:hypothetical protein [Halalkalibacter wakoensis]GAE27618.1 hypothetical protein JCM9140_3771 [Halalkalibacter wakoensis JCM 9140]